MSERDTGAGELLPIVLARRVLICVGSGGVGKTSMAAALGLLAVRAAARRSLVMTIDPAWRLATSLGLGQLSNEQKAVPADRLAAYGLQPDLLYAMRLDPKRTFDDLVRRYAPDETTAQRLLASKLYQQISSRLAGSQEYAAMEQLYEIFMTRTYDLLVLDTPPTANALDFLDAPRKMVDAVESPAVSLFINTYRRAGRLSLNVLGFGAAYVVRRLARFTGGGFLDDIAAFLSDLSALLGGMHDRAAQVEQLLARDEVGFVIVTSPDPRAIDEAIALHDRLGEAGISPSAVIINRVHPLDGQPPEADQVAREIIAAGVPLAPEDAGDLAQVLAHWYEELQVLAQADAAEVARLREHCGEGRPYIQVPLFDKDVHDIGELVQLTRYLS